MMADSLSTLEAKVQTSQHYIKYFILLWSKRKQTLSLNNLFKVTEPVSMSAPKLFLLSNHTVFSHKISSWDVLHHFFRVCFFFFSK